MQKIQMVDLKGQYQKIKTEIDKAILNVIDSTAYINGPAVKDFQTSLEEYLSVRHVIPCANGTDALQVSLMALDLEPGDEIITTPFTFIATVEVISLLGLTPVFVDVEPDSFNIDPEKVEQAITARTKAIIPVHLFGQCADMDSLMAIARKHNLYVIEDACQSIGAEYIFRDGSRKQSGTIGHIGCTSFFPSKNLGCYGDGGAIFTNDDELAQKIRVLVNHGMTRRYYHDMIGVNSRLDSVQAAVLNVKLSCLKDYIRSRQAAAGKYDKAFSNHPKLQIPGRKSYSTHVFHQYTLQVKESDRFGLQDYLNSKEIPAMVYYPVPLHLQKAFNDPRYKKGDFPVTEQLCNTVISLPMHTELDDEQLNYITGSVLSYLNKQT